MGGGGGQRAEGARRFWGADLLQVKAGVVDELARSRAHRLVHAEVVAACKADGLGHDDAAVRHNVLVADHRLIGVGIAIGPAAADVTAADPEIVRVIDKMKMVRRLLPLCPPLHILPGREYLRWRSVIAPLQREAFMGDPAGHLASAFIAVTISTSCSITVPQPSWKPMASWRSRDALSGCNTVAM